MKRPDERGLAGGRVTLVVVLVLALLLGGGYAAAYAVAGDKTPRDTVVSGVDIGGMTPAAAREALVEGLADRAAAPLRVSLGDRSDEIDPAEAGLSIDYDATVAAAGTERSWSPSRLWDYFTGGDDVEAVVAVDEQALDAALAELEAGLGEDPVDARVVFTDGEVSTTPAEPGRGLEPDSTRAALTAAYLSGDPVDLEITSLEPDVTDAEAAEAVRTFAEPALAGPVNLRFGSAGVRLAPDDFADALSLEPGDDGALVPAVDADLLVPLVEDATAGDGDPVDASIRLVDGRPRVVKAKPGISFEPADVAAAFLEVVARPRGERSVDVEGTVEQPAFTTADARALGVKRKVSEFTTYFPYAEYRNTNIGRAAELVDGTLLKPGETFSLNDIVGERTRENGFTEGYIISNGILKLDLGGGVSQMATTLFNGMFFAGLEDVEHKPHSFYIDRYPVGREATVAWGSVDLRFRNNTEHGVLVNAEVKPSTPSTQGEATVRMFSTKVWDIDTTTGERYAYVGPATRVLDTPDCEPNTGYSGFQIDVTRIFREPGSDEVVRTEKFHTDYTPSDTVVCRPPGSIKNP
ncbi:VanW family protein [Nocardioides dongxiaopingii]|uniref:VanW family protein n=1 Tax=Nocardioides dongxiaopingii TaxID=2576036 RepID=UPI0010C7683B|nr:VanW family protein [Nocardioides dongxiaopingii]